MHNTCGTRSWCLHWRREVLANRKPRTQVHAAVNSNVDSRVGRLPSPRGDARHIPRHHTSSTLRTDESQSNRLNTRRGRHTYSSPSPSIFLCLLPPPSPFYQQRDAKIREKKSTKQEQSKQHENTTQAQTQKKKDGKRKHTALRFFTATHPTTHHLHTYSCDKGTNLQ